MVPVNDTGHVTPERPYLSADPALPLEVMRAALSAAHPVQKSVFEEDGERAQDEGAEQVHVDVVPHAVQLPEGNTNGRTEICDQEKWAI